MLKELVDAAARLRAQNALPPSGTKSKNVTWIIEISESRATDAIEPKGPFKGKDVRSVRAPDRQRSGSVSPDNLKAYLLVDNGRYALGIRERGKVDKDDVAHRGYIDLLQRAHDRTADPDLSQILAFLRQPIPESVVAKIAPDDFLTFQAESGDFLCERATMQEFWKDHLEQEHTGETVATCGVCGDDRRIVRILPREIVVMGQKCQLTSFNLSAFESFGKKQTANAPLCYACAASAIDALDYYIREPRHHAALTQDDSRSGAKNPLRNQLAVSWLKSEEPISYGGVEIDPQALVALLNEEQPQPETNTPPPELGQLEALLQTPQTGSESALHLCTNSFYLAVLSANKGRLVVREWIAVSLDQLLQHLAIFLRAARIVGPNGEPPRALPVPTLIAALKTMDPNLTRGLLRAAYLGYPPPTQVLAAAVERFRVQDKATDSKKEREQRAHWRHALAAALKLVLTYGKEDAERMQTLDTTRNIPAYLCGRLLAVLEEAQQRASGWKLNATLIDRFYGAASSAPAATFGTLLELAMTGHLPKLRKEKLGHHRIQQLLEEIISRLDEAGGFPRTLTAPGQAEFAVGYYLQRAHFSAERKQHKAGEPEAQTGGAS